MKRGIFAWLTALTALAGCTSLDGLSGGGPDGAASPDAGMGPREAGRSEGGSRPNDSGRHDAASHPDGSTHGDAQPAGSADCVTDPPATQLDDGHGNVYTLSGGQIEQNGVIDQSTYEVVVILLHNGLLFQQNQIGIWYSTDGSGWPSSTWVALGTNADPCTGTNDGGSDTGTGASTFMAAPSGWSYSQLVFETQFGYSGMGTSPASPNQGTFVSNGVPTPDTSVGFLNDWNYGMQQQAGAEWNASGSAPYWGTSQGNQTGTYASGDSADYSFPGNLFQTSTGSDASLFGTYSPQTFTSHGTGLTLADIYVGGPQQLSCQCGGNTYYYYWTSGVLNTEGKRFFPYGSATEFYAQVSAKMAGPNNGSWSAIWMLPDQGEDGTGQEIDIQEYNVDGPSPETMYSHVQEPAVLVGTGTSTAPLDAGYHVYGWHVNSTTQTLTLYLDGVQTGTFTGAQVGSKYFLILDAAVSSGQQTWQSSEGFVTNSNADMAMSVAEVQVYQP
jgi:hypothetical protein